MIYRAMGRSGAPILQPFLKLKNSPPNVGSIDFLGLVLFTSSGQRAPDPKQLVVTTRTRQRYSFSCSVNHYSYEKLYMPTRFYECTAASVRGGPINDYGSCESTLREYDDW
jgi:hypothetical protein